MAGIVIIMAICIASILSTGTAFLWAMGYFSDDGLIKIDVLKRIFRSE